MGYMARFKEKYHFVVQQFNGKLLYTFALLVVCPFTFGFDNQGFATVLAMDGFIETFGDKNPDTGEYAIEPVFLSLLNSLQYIGFAIGLYIGSLISARWGRKKTVFVECVYSWIPATICITAASKPQILIGRILNFVYVGMELAVVPVFQSEIAPKPLRGLFVSTYQMAIMLGGLVINAVCYGTAHMPGPPSWQIPLGLYYVLPTCISIAIWFAPESPRWLLTKNRPEDAYEELKKIRRGDCEEEFLEMKFLISATADNGSYKELFKGTNIIRTLIAIFMNFFLQATGQAFASQYSAVYIKGLGMDPFGANIVRSATSAAGNAVCLLFVDKVGRRRFIILSGVLQTIFMFAMGGIGTKDNLSDQQKFAVVAMLMAYGTAWCLGWAPLSYVVTAEVPSPRLRDKTQQVGQFVNILFTFVVTFTLPYLLYEPYAALDAKVGFIYAGIGTIATVFAFLYVPECSNRSLEEIDYMFNTKVPCRKFDKYVIPEAVMDKARAEEEHRKSIEMTTA